MKRKLYSPQHTRLVFFVQCIFFCLWGREIFLQQYDCMFLRVYLSLSLPNSPFNPLFLSSHLSFLLFCSFCLFIIIYQFLNFIISLNKVKCLVEKVSCHKNFCYLIYVIIMKCCPVKRVFSPPPPPPPPHI